MPSILRLMWLDGTLLVNSPLLYFRTLFQVLLDLFSPDIFSGLFPAINRSTSLQHPPSLTTGMPTSSISPRFSHSSFLHLLCNVLGQVSILLGNHLRVLYLFTRSDFKTMILPIV